MLNMGLLWNNGPKYSRLRQERDIKSNGVKYEPVELFEALEISDDKTRPKDPSGEYNRLRHVAILVSWISVIFSFASGIGAIVLGQLLESESLFGYGLDAVLDSLSSVAVLWRFYSNCVSEAAEAKERKACIVISIFFFASSASLIFKSVQNLNKGERDKASEDERIISDCFSGICSLVTLTLGIIKVIYGRRLQSRSLITDSVITFVGSFMSLSSVVSLELFIYDHRIWYLDGVCGLLCAIFLLTFGVKLLIQMTCLYGKPKSKHSSLDGP